MNDYHAWRLACVYGGLWATPELGGGPFLYTPLLPVTLRFEGLLELHPFQTQPEGRLHRLKHALRANLDRLYEFVDDLVIENSDRQFAIAMEFRTYPERRTYLSWDPKSRIGETHGHRVLLCVACQRLRVIDGQREAWARLFGEDKLWVYERFDQERRRRKFYGLNEFEEFLSEVGAPPAGAVKCPLYQRFPRRQGSRRAWAQWRRWEPKRAIIYESKG